jgi:hypothetical protein
VSGKQQELGWLQAHTTFPLWPSHWRCCQTANEASLRPQRRRRRERGPPSSAAGRTPSCTAMTSGFPPFGTLQPHHLEDNVIEGKTCRLERNAIKWMHRGMNECVTNPQSHPICPIHLVSLAAQAPLPPTQHHHNRNAVSRPQATPKTLSSSPSLPLFLSLKSPLFIFMR